MKSTVDAETARQWLEDAFGELSKFRNANTRDAQFKQWRQNTLTVVQRIWPGVTSKSQRFRRVPFAPPSTLADTKQIREAFERGCAEVGILLRSWISEIEEYGVRDEPSEIHEAAGSAAESGAPTLDLDQPSAPSARAPDEVPTLDLSAVMGGRAPRSTAPKAVPAKGRKSGRVTPVPSEPKVVPLAIVPPPSGVTAAAKPAGDTPATAPAASQFAPPPERPKAKGGKKKNGARLKDMLGLSNFKPTPAAEAPAVAESPAVAEPAVVAELPPAPLAQVQDAAEVTELEVVSFETARMPSEEPVLELAPLTPIVDIELADVAPLSTADALPAASVRPPLAIVPPAPAQPALPEATTIALIATELAVMDVPPNEREALQRALIQLALHLESGACSWAEMRDAVHRVMEHPTLARRALPALIPFLDRAA